MNSIPVKVNGRTHHADDRHLRDDSGKPVATRIPGGDLPCKKLAYAAAGLMSGHDVAVRDGKVILLDLGNADVASATGARAAFVPLIAQDFVADRVSPIKMIQHDRGSYWIESVADSFQVVQSIAASGGGTPPELNPGFTATPFVCVPYALAGRVPQSVMVNADFDLGLAILRRITNALRLARETRVATLVLASASWATGNRVAAGAKWNGGTNPAPLTDIFASRATAAVPPTTLVVSEAAEQYFYAQPTGDTSNQVRDFVQAGGQLPDVLLGRARVMSAGVASYVWGNAGTSTNAALIREVNDPNTDIGTCRTLRWVGDAPDGESYDGFLVRRYHMKEGANGSDVIVVAHSDVDVMVQPTSQIGALITGVLA